MHDIERRFGLQFESLPTQPISTRQIDFVGVIGMFALFGFRRQPIHDTQFDQVAVQKRLASRCNGRVAVTKHSDGRGPTPRRPKRPLDGLACIARKLGEYESAQHEKSTATQEFDRPLTKGNPRTDGEEKREGDHGDRGNACT